MTVPLSTRLTALALACALAFAFWIAPDAHSAGSVAISNERTDTSWAFVQKAIPVRARPRAGARKVGSIGLRTFYSFRDVVLVLRETRAGRPWSLIRYPGLGRRTGWVPSSALGGLHWTDRQIVVDRERTRLRVLRDGKVVFRTRIGVGAESSPTPAGRTYLRERLVPRNKDEVYGVLAFGLSAYSPFRTDWAGGGQVGIHGTNQPELIPGHISNGCIRLHNRAIRRVDRLTGVGTPVLIK